jgi:hypothetical protein
MRISAIKVLTRALELDPICGYFNIVQSNT